MFWFKKYTFWYQCESEELSSNPYFTEAYQYCDNIFVSCGEIVLTMRKIIKFPIVILYPEYTPYHYPKIIFTNELIKKEDLIELSKLSFTDAILSLKDKVKFFDKVRHQMQDGSLCVLEYENLYNENPDIYSIKDILKRTRDWLVGIETGHFPKDSPEVSLYNHFRNIEDKYDFLLPDLFYNDKYEKGEFYSSNMILFDYYPSERYTKRKSYFGTLLLGSNGNLFLPTIENSDRFRMFTIYSPKFEDLYPEINEDIKNQIKKDPTENGLNIIKVYWWNINVEPVPFSNIDSLMEYIGNGDKNKGYSEIFNINDFKGFSDLLHIGLRYKNRKDEYEWLILKIEKTNEGAIIINPSFQDFAECIRNKYTIKAVKSEIFSDKYFHQRNSKLASREILLNKKVGIIGCGALGSEIADILSKAGTQDIILIDNQILHANNVVRHLCGLEKVNLLKIDSVHYNLALQNPFINISSFGNDIFKSDITSYLPLGYIGISSIADDNVEAYLNENAIENNRIVFYARALRGGRAARIFRVIPGKDACKQCLAIYYEEDNKKFINIPLDESLGTIRNECNNPIRPASAAELKLIASLTSRIIIDYLQEGDNGKNHWIWTTEKLEGFPSIDENINGYIFGDFIEPHKDCPICQKKEKLNIIFCNEIKEFIINECKNSINIETGGILIGFTDKDNIYVTLATGPGPNAVKKKSIFIKDKDYCQDILKKEYLKHGSKGNYIGEWHFHPNGGNIPSQLDIRSLSEISVEKEYLTENPLMIIVSSNYELSCTVHPMNNRYYFSDYEIKN